MKVVIAIDSFKGSMTSIEAGLAARSGVLAARPDAEVIVKPLADGGEGTVDALTEGLSGEKIELTVTGPMGKPVSCYYGHLKESDTAVIEMASAAGITLVPANEKNPFNATTYGVGEIILDAVNKGIKKFIIGIGGSATNDGGLGMLQALGFRFSDKNGNDVGFGGKALSKIHSIDISSANPLLKECHFRIACDVTNPLYGSNGATYIYGPQKGVLESELSVLDSGMIHYAAVTKQITGTDFSQSPGAGAAGGLGFAFLSYLNAELLPGVDLIIDSVNLKNDLKNADVIITGEGRLDKQTAMGKAPVGVAKLAYGSQTKVIAFAGSVTKDAVYCNSAGITAFFPIVRGVTALEEAMTPSIARQNMADTVEQVFRLL